MVDFKVKASRPDPEVELKSAGSGPVKTYKMSPEELEDYRARTGYKEPKENITHVATQSNVKAVVGRKSANGPDKKEFLELIAKGSSVAAAERSMGLKANGIYHWLKKWGLTGIKQDKAKELLGMVDQPEDHVIQNASLADYEKKLAEWESLQQELLQVRLENKELKETINVYGEEISRWVQADKEKAVLIAEMTEDRDNWRQTAQEAKQAIAELEEDRSLLLATLDKASEVAVSKEHDSVNHPSHYTQGGVECIDAIEAALTGVTGGYAYATGAAIKYLWRWQRKNGVEDLRKAVWYINRMIDLLERDERAGSVLSRDTVGNHR